MNGFAPNRRRMSLDKQGPTVVYQKPGPLQTIFNLPADEVSCIDSVFMAVVFSWGLKWHLYDHKCMGVASLRNCVCFRWLIIVILVHLRGHSYIMAVCMFLHGAFASIQMCFLSKWRLASHSSFLDWPNIVLVNHSFKESRNLFISVI